LARLRQLIGGDGRKFWTRPFKLSLLYRALHDGRPHQRCLPCCKDRR
jgi:hypothetical protein